MASHEADPDPPPEPPEPDERVRIDLPFEEALRALLSTRVEPETAPTRPKTPK